MQSSFHYKLRLGFLLRLKDKLFPFRFPSALGVLYELCRNLIARLTVRFLLVS